MTAGFAFLIWLLVEFFLTALVGFYRFGSIKRDLIGSETLFSSGNLLKPPYKKLSTSFVNAMDFFFPYSDIELSKSFGSISAIIS